MTSRARPLAVGFKCGLISGRNSQFVPIHKKMKPSKLYLKRKEYQEFPADIFRVRLNKEVDRVRCLKYWAHKRNLEGMKRHLKEIEERAANAQMNE